MHTRKLSSHARALTPRTVLLALVIIALVLAILDAAGLPTLRLTFCHAFPLPSVVSRRPILDKSAHKAAEHRPSQWTRLNTLVLVAGHAIFTGAALDKASFLNENNWILEPFQKGQVATFLRHIERGVRIAANDSTALLLFSGGQTRDNAGPRSEGLSYWLAASSAQWYGVDASLRNRTLAEEYARDSLENLMFSVCRFRQVVGHYPRSITVVGFEFKRARFEQMHRQAIRFPAERFEYVGIDPPGTDGSRGVTAGERARAMGPFMADPYGCKTSVLSGKREDRNPYLRFHPYPQGCPEMAALFSYCGHSIYKGPLPWDSKLSRQEPPASK